MKYNLTLTDNQAEVIKIALEEYFRIRMGQFLSLADDLAFEGYHYDKKDPQNSEKFDQVIQCRNDAQEKFEEALKAAQPERKNKAVPKTDIMLIAEDLWQEIRHRLYLDRGGRCSNPVVDAREPLRMSEEPMPELSRVEDINPGCGCCAGDIPLFWKDNENNSFIASHGEILATVADKTMRYKVKYCPNCGRKIQATGLKEEKKC